MEGVSDTIEQHGGTPFPESVLVDIPWAGFSKTRDLLTWLGEIPGSKRSQITGIVLENIFFLSSSSARKAEDLLPRLAIYYLEKNIGQFPSCLEEASSHPPSYIISLRHDRCICRDPTKAEIFLRLWPAKTIIEPPQVDDQGVLNLQAFDSNTRVIDIVAGRERTTQLVLGNENHPSYHESHLEAELPNLRSINCIGQINSYHIQDLFKKIPTLMEVVENGNLHLCQDIVELGSTFLLMDSDLLDSAGACTFSSLKGVTDRIAPDQNGVLNLLGLGSQRRLESIFERVDQYNQATELKVDSITPHDVLCIKSQFPNLVSLTVTDISELAARLPSMPSNPINYIWHQLKTLQTIAVGMPIISHSRPASV